MLEMELEQLKIKFTNYKNQFNKKQVDSQILNALKDMTHKKNKPDTDSDLVNQLR